MRQLFLISLLILTGIIPAVAPPVHQAQPQVRFRHTPERSVAAGTSCRWDQDWQAVDGLTYRWVGLPPGIRNCNFVGQSGEILERMKQGDPLRLEIEVGDLPMGLDICTGTYTADRVIAGQTCASSTPTVWPQVVGTLVVINPNIASNANGFLIGRSTNGVSFDETDPAQLWLVNAFYAIGLSRGNGAITALIDRERGINLTLGSRGGCLWGASFPSNTARPDYVGGCSYTAGTAQPFQYTWNSAASTLQLQYTGNRSAPGYVDATVSLIVGTAASFDMRMTMMNALGATALKLHFPSDLRFEDERTRAGYGTFVLPGLRLSHEFFLTNSTYTPSYPGHDAFADYVALDVGGSHLAISSVNPAPQSVRPVTLGFHDDEALTRGTFYLVHSFLTWTTHGQQVTTPAVRVHVGRPVSETILAYRQANALDIYPSVATKTGSQFTALTKAPLIKMDVDVLGRPFSDLEADLMRLPSPALLHPVAYQPEGFDEYYPDFLPVDQDLGTTADFRDFVVAAQARGMLVMPYINPTWWDNESPTLESLPAPYTVQDVAILDSNLQPVMESYGSNGEHQGYIVSPHAPFVKQRLASLMSQWQQEVPVNCIFEDQIGARDHIAGEAGVRDFNPASPTPYAYYDGWLAHTQQYASRCLMTEQGWDRLAQTEVGFHGSGLLWREYPPALDDADAQWRLGHWSPYPLALWLFHDKVLMYQHDLSLVTMSDDLSTLTWNLAFGMMLSYNWQWEGNQPLDNPWLKLVALLQRTVAARYAGQALTSYTEFTPYLSETRFGSLQIRANWSPWLTSPITTTTLASSLIAPGGFFAQTDDQAVIAGAFTDRFNQMELSAGEHYLVVERTAQAVTVYQPVGSNTQLSIRGPSAWVQGSPLDIEVHNVDGQLIDVFPAVWIEGRDVHFFYEQQQGNQEVGSYHIVMSSTVSGRQTWLPILEKRMGPL